MIKIKERMGEVTMSKKNHSSNNAFSIIALVLGLISVVVAALYMIYRFLSDRAYQEKWKDYDDCGLA